MTGHKEELVSERAINERYQRELQELVASGAKIAVSHVGPASQKWTGPIGKPAPSGAILEPLYGRVELEVDDVLLGRDFYIGSWYREWDGVRVISWAAPVASLFFQGRSSKDELADMVVVQRTFERSVDDIRDFHDDATDGLAGRQPFAGGRKSTLEVPMAPPVARPRTPLSSASQRPPEPPGSGGDEVEREPHDVHTRASTVAGEPPLRARKAVLAAIRQPRTGRLPSVLATLQPEQYRLVAWSADRPLIVQGQPGTGKTVIATHRAAFLAHRERKDARLDRIALIGPSPQYVEHVSRVIRDLETDGVEIFSLPSFLQRTTQLGKAPPPGREQRLDSAWEVGRAAGQVARLFLRSPQFVGLSHTKKMRTVVEALIEGGDTVQQVAASSPELRRWFANIRSWDGSVRDDRYLPLLASISLALAPVTSGERFHHIVIDEAQDVRPLEWKVIMGHLHPRGQVSLFGDLNQRRSDWSPNSWLKLASDLSLTDDEGMLEPEVIETGFRSTKQILRFANQLLPRGTRSATALQVGVPPTVIKVLARSLVTQAKTSAESLARRHPNGFVAIITMDPKDLSDSLRQGGWARSHRTHGWTRQGIELIVLHPANARGLEFDGVVVVEPANFPENVGRLGQLYTSLTRATQELTVVHAKGLPAGLRVR